MKVEKSQKQTRFYSGMYLLETLTSGMYNDPLSIYREYVQNAVDSIDTLKKDSEAARIDITIEPSKKRIVIKDTGPGIPPNLVDKILCSIGKSAKNDKSRGFRGIGRLGGLAFCREAIFRTKASGSVFETVQKWNCDQFREMKSKQQRFINLEEVLNEIVSFESNNGQSPEGSYFEVTLEGVSSFRNHILDIEKVRNYLAQVVPLPFNHDKFPFACSVDKFLENRLRNYQSYNIYLNGKPLHKPYSNRVTLSRKGADLIDGIEFLEINTPYGQPLAYGWYGLRREFLGTIAKNEVCSGIRVRVGNILLGDSHLLDGCFKENRFNGYLVGEIHIAEGVELIPNSRRDDFIDNADKTQFYNEIERQVGLPLSRVIREKSRRSSMIQSNSQAVTPDPVKTKPAEKQEPSSESVMDLRINELAASCGQCPRFDHLLRVLGISQSPI